MGHPGTAPDVLEDAMEFVRSLGLLGIRVNGEIMGYGGNRIWRAVKKEVLYLLDRGHVTPEDVDRGWIAEWNTSMGPCGLMDEIGLDVVRDIEMVYYKASGDPSDRPPALLLEMIAQGKLGVKTGEGFYRYPNPSYRQPGWLLGKV
jgi:3-hydroxyacyl-CoA dehydrogenase